MVIYINRRQLVKIYFQNLLIFREQGWFIWRAQGRITESHFSFLIEIHGRRWRHFFLIFISATTTRVLPPTSNPGILRALTECSAPFARRLLLVARSDATRSGCDSWTSWGPRSPSGGRGVLLFTQHRGATRNNPYMWIAHWYMIIRPAFLSVLLFPAGEHKTSGNQYLRQGQAELYITLLYEKEFV